MAELTGSWHRRRDVLQRSIDEFVVLGRVDGDVLEIHGPAATVWSTLERRHAYGEIVDEMLQRFEGDRDGVADGVAAVLQRLFDEGLVERRDVV